MKIPGYELRVVAALREHGLIERTLISGMFTGGLDQIRAAEPALRLGWSVPRVRRDYTTDMLTAIPALAILTGYRAMLPRRVRAALSSGRFDAIMAHWRVVTPALVKAVREGGGELYVWTVDDAAHDRQADRDGRRRHHHQRPAAVQPMRQLARAEARRVSAREALVPGAGRPRHGGLQHASSLDATGSSTTPRSVEGGLAGTWHQLEAPAALARRARPGRRARSAGSAPLGQIDPLLGGASRYCRRKLMYILSCGGLSPGIEPRIPTVSGWSAGLQTSIVAHSCASERSRAFSSVLFPARAWRQPARSGPARARHR